MSPDTNDMEPGSECYRGIRIILVHGSVTPELREELIAFWLNSGALGSRQQAEKRVREAVHVVLNEQGRIVGVNTVFPGKLVDGVEQIYWFYRTFIHPEYRFPGLSSRVFRSTVWHLAGLPRASGMPTGLALVAENPKLYSPAGRRKLQRLGLRPRGKDRGGREVWSLEFED